LRPIKKATEMIVVIEMPAKIGVLTACRRPSRLKLKRRIFRLSPVILYPASILADFKESRFLHYS
jgi:hypothetical protein